MTSMNIQFIEKAGKKEYAVIPYKEYLRMNEIVEDHADLKTLRKTKSEADYDKRKRYETVAKKLGLMR